MRPSAIRLYNETTSFISKKCAQLSLRQRAIAFYNKLSILLVVKNLNIEFKIEDLGWKAEGRRQKAEVDFS